MSTDDVDERDKSQFLANLTTLDIIECLTECLPFLKKENYIAESEYRLTLLDTIELLISLLKRDIAIRKRKQISIQVAASVEETLKLNKNNARKLKKSVKK
jgi:hypothetical protein